MATEPDCPICRWPVWMHVLGSLRSDLCLFQTAQARLVAVLRVEYRAWRARWGCR